MQEIWQEPVICREWSLETADNNFYWGVLPITKVQRVTKQELQKTDCRKPNFLHCTGTQLHRLKKTQLSQNSYSRGTAQTHLYGFLLFLRETDYLLLKVILEAPFFTIALYKAQWGFHTGRTWGLQGRGIRDRFKVSFISRFGFLWVLIK